MQLLQFMERMQLDYHKAAEKKGVYAISSCGYVSVPPELGIVFLMNKFQGLSLKIPCYWNTLYSYNGK
jgi:short subunit dehydrogenase-like uncharacterized protein